MEPSLPRKITGCSCWSVEFLYRDVGLNRENISTRSIYSNQIVETSLVLVSGEVSNLTVCSFMNMIGTSKFDDMHGVNKVTYFKFTLRYIIEYRRKSC